MASAAEASSRLGTCSTNSEISTTSLTQSMKKLDGAMATGQSNYNAWRFRIVRILKEKDLLSTIEDSDIPVSASKDNQAFTIITLNIKDSQIPYIQDTRTTKEAWSALQEVHNGIGMNGRMVLMQRLWGLRMSEGDDMAQHLNLFRELSNQLQSLSQDGKGIDDTELVTILTLSLPESYEPLVMALQSRTDTVTFDIMAGRLLQESDRRQISQTTNSIQGGSNASQTAFTAQPPTVPRGQRGRGGYTFNGRGRGIFSGRNRGAGPGVSNRIPGKIRRNVAHTSSSAQTGSKCDYCRKVGHWKRDCYKRKSEEASQNGVTRRKEFTFLAEEVSDQPGVSWIVDSGVSQHLSCHRTQFTSYWRISKPQSITMADGTKIEAHGIGDIVLETKVGVIKLTNVWHVPNIGASLISMARMVDSGFSVEFNRDTCFVMYADIRTELGYRKGSLYYLTQDTVEPPSASMDQALIGLTTNQAPSATLKMWHRRLCYLTLDASTVWYLSSRVSGMQVRGKGEATAKICSICALGRQHKEAHTKGREKATEILKIVHTDICGPMQTPCLNGQKYLITFTDEMSG